MVHGPFGPYALCDKSPVNEGYLFTGPAGLAWYQYAASGLQPFTCEAMMYGSGAGDGTIIAASPFSLAMNAAAAVSFIIYTSSSYRWAYNISISTNVWHHLVGVFRGTGIAVELWVDGKRYTGSSGSGTNNAAASTIGFGTSTSWSSGFRGGLGFGAIYRGAMSHSEIVRRSIDPWGLFQPTRRRVVRVPVGGGPFTITPSGAVTPAAALGRLVGKVSAGAVVGAGVAQRSAGKVPAGAVTASGAASKTASKVAAGAVTPTGVLEAIRTLLRTFAGAVTPTGALVRQAGKVAAGAVAGAGSVVQRAVTKAVAGATAAAGALAKATSRPLAGAVTASGVVATVKVVLVTLTGAVVSAGILARSAGKGVVGAVAPGGAVAKAVARSWAGAVAASGGLAKLVGRVLAGAVTAAGVLGTVLGGAVRVPAGALVAIVADNRVLARMGRLGYRVTVLAQAIRAKINS